MSCETNFHAYCQQIAGAGSDVAAAFGGDPQHAQAALQQIFQTARNQAPSPGAPTTNGKLQALQAQTMKHQATDATTRLFDEMRGKQITPPTHSATGLPKPDAQRGYAAVWQTLQAIRERKPLPELAQQIRTQQQLHRTIRGVGVDGHAVTPHQVQQGAHTKVSFGTTYDVGRFMGPSIAKVVLRGHRSPWRATPIRSASGPATHATMAAPAI